jgi:hypothetical protein
MTWVGGSWMICGTGQNGDAKYIKESNGSYVSFIETIHAAVLKGSTSISLVKKEF